MFTQERIKIRIVENSSASMKTCPEAACSTLAYVLILYGGGKNVDHGHMFDSSIMYLLAYGRSMTMGDMEDVLIKHAWTHHGERCLNEQRGGCGQGKMGQHGFLYLCIKNKKDDDYEVGKVRQKFLKDKVLRDRPKDQTEKMIKEAAVPKRLVRAPTLCMAAGSMGMIPRTGMGPLLPPGAIIVEAESVEAEMARGEARVASEARANALAEMAVEGEAFEARSQL